MNNLIKATMIEQSKHYTENGAITYGTTANAVLDMFALGGAYRKRTDAEIVQLFKTAYDENSLLALKCLFFLRDREQGQGERRFMRVCLHFLGTYDRVIAEKLIPYIPYFGRYDDLFAFMGTATQEAMTTYVLYNLNRDYSAKEDEYITLLAKWMPSENASSKETRQLAHYFREQMGVSHKAYRQILSYLRGKLKVLEKTMSANQWDEIQFDKIPSKAGLKYRKCFMRREETFSRYIKFIQNKETKVNASVLYPYDVAHEIMKLGGRRSFFDKANLNDDEIASIQKYWDNLPDFFEGKNRNILPVVDTSGSMSGRPIEVAVSLGAYCAERTKGDFKNYFMTFSTKPELIKFRGSNIVEKFYNATRANWEMNTDLEAVFELLKKAVKKTGHPEDLPDTILIISDMQFDCCLRVKENFSLADSLMDTIKKDWAEEGLKIPNVVFWNVNARYNDVPAIGKEFSYVSGFSPSIMKVILNNTTPSQLMYETLDNDRYNFIHDIIKS